MAPRRFDPEILTIKNPAYYRTYWLIRDKQFIVDVELLRQDILNYYPTDQGFFNYEPDVLLDAGVLKSVVNNMTILARHYYVSAEFVRRYLDGMYPLKGSGLFHEVAARAKAEDGWIVLRFGLDITSEQFYQLRGMFLTLIEQPRPEDKLVAHEELYRPPYIEDGWVVLKLSKDLGSVQFRKLWSGVSELLEQTKGSELSKKRRRAPANYELIYYIEKAKLNGSGFPEIAAMYNDSKLPGYHHQSYERPYSTDAIRDYYNDYKFLDH